MPSTLAKWIGKAWFRGDAENTAQWCDTVADYLKAGKSLE
jgi:hypothetical protein